jgi:hypothetical protein
VVQRVVGALDVGNVNAGDADFLRQSLLTQPSFLSQTLIFISSRLGDTVIL